MLEVVALHALDASAASLATDGSLSLSLRILDDDGKPVHFRRLELALLATVRAKPATTPNQPLQQVAQVAGTISFTAAEQAAPSFAKLVIANLASLDASSIELMVQATAYPGMVAAKTRLTT